MIEKALCKMSSGVTWGPREAFPLFLTNGVPTDRPTDRQTDRPTDRPIYRDADFVSI